VELPDAYLSIGEALKHACIANGAQADISWISAESLEITDAEEVLKGVFGILIPGGFGERGLDGKMKAAKYARENGVPLLGICLGMQMAAVEFARNVLGLRGAHSSEVDPLTPYPVIDLMEDQRGLRMGGTLRLGGYDCELSEGSLAKRLYGANQIRERHRHRYEFNNDFIDRFEKAGMRFSGVNRERNLMEIMELPSHPFFLGVQFHPEFNSRPDSPHPVFLGFISAAVKHGKIHNN
jgi:CTP synthase